MADQGQKAVEFVPPGGWLWQFAGMFHQDYGLEFNDFRSGATAYVQSLSTAERKALRAELSAFLAKHADLPPNSFKRMWLKLGADWCQGDIDMREALNDVVREL